MSSPRLRVPLVALVALAVVAAGIVFFVLRRGPGYEGEIPLVNEDKIPVFTAEVSTVSLPIKADCEELVRKMRKAAMRDMKLPMRMKSGSEEFAETKVFGKKISYIVFYYTADLLSLDFSLRPDSDFWIVPSHLRQRPMLTVKGKIHLYGPLQQKSAVGKLFNYGDYDGEFEFTKLYTMILDESANLIFSEFGELVVKPSSTAEVKVGSISFDDFLGVLKKHVTPVLSEKVDAELEKRVKVDYLTPLYDTGWMALHDPIKLMNRVWLVFHPEEFEVAQLRGSGTTLETTVTVRGRPKVVLGDKPQVPKAPRMPPVRLGEAKGGVHVVVDAIVPLDQAERLLNKELGGLEKVIYDQAKVKVKVPKARIYSCENCLRLELLLTKPFRGSVFLDGAPRYDAETNELYVEGLDFTVDTKNILAKSASWLLESPVLKDYLQTKARLPVGGQLANVGEAISKYDGEEIAEGMVLQLGDTSFKILCVYNTREAMHLIAQADGSAEVTVK